MTQSGSQPLHIMLVSGEPSGDRLGARLIAALKSAAPVGTRFSGVGGRNMEREGVSSLFSIDDMAVMGLAQVAPMVFKVFARVNKVVAFAMEEQPDAVVLIDSSGFTDRIGVRLRKRGYTGAIVKYVAPQVWASRPYRVSKIAKFIDHVLTLYPFEPEYFTAEGLDATFVGHPLTEESTDQSEDQSFREKYNIDGDSTYLCVLPGSRSNELSFLLPVFRQTVERLAGLRSDLKLIVPVTPNLAEKVHEEMRAWPVSATVVEEDEYKYSAFRASKAALAASGTVTLELAMNGVPMVVAYKVGWLTSTIFRPFILSKYICILNVLAGRRIVPEFIQEECHPQLLANATQALLQNDMARSGQIQNITRAFESLRDHQSSPSERAARAVMATIDNNLAERKDEMSR